MTTYKPIFKNNRLIVKKLIEKIKTFCNIIGFVLQKISKYLNKKISSLRTRIQLTMQEMDSMQ